MNLLRSIHIFQQVAEDKSFSVAADKLNLVPSAVSRQISELEKWLGVRLFNRTTRSIHLTDDGERYLARMSEILYQVEGLKSLHTEKNVLSGSVRITAPNMLGHYYLPSILASFKKKHPRVSLSLTLMNRKVDLIEEGYDLAIRGGVLSDSNFHAKKISEVSFKTVASKSYLETVQINLPKDLTLHNCIVNTAVPQPKRWKYIIDGKEKVIKIDGDLEVNDSSCILKLVKSGFGIARLPEQYVKDAIDQGELVEVLKDYQPEPLSVNIIFPSNKLISPTQRALIDFIADSLKF